MSRIQRILTAIFFIIGAAAFAQSSNTVAVIFNITDFIGNAQSVQRLVLQPLPPTGGAGMYGPNILVPARNSFPTGTNGSVTVSNVATGYAYKVQLIGQEQPPNVIAAWTNVFSTNLAGQTVYASACLGVNAGPVFGWLLGAGTNVVFTYTNGTLYINSFAQGGGGGGGSFSPEVPVTWTNAVGTPMLVQDAVGNMYLQNNGQLFAFGGIFTNGLQVNGALNVVGNSTLGTVGAASLNIFAGNATIDSSGNITGASLNGPGTGITANSIPISSLTQGPLGYAILGNGFGNAASYQLLPGSGTVTSVGLTPDATLFAVGGSPVTAAGTLTFSLNAQNAGQVWASPPVTPGAPFFTNAPTFIGSNVTLLNAANLTGFLPYGSLPSKVLTNGYTGAATLGSSLSVGGNLSTSGSATANVFNGSGAGITSDSMPLASLVNGTPLTLLGYNGSGNAANLTNASVNLINTNTPHTIWVEASGSDTLNNGTNRLSPFATLTNALYFATNLAIGTNVILVGPGVFNVPSNTFIPANTTIMGAGEQATRIITPTNTAAAGFIIAGDNVTLREFTLGTNALAGLFYFPLVPQSGTNFLALNFAINGDSDGVYAAGVPSVTNLFFGTFRGCSFKSGYDCVNVEGNNAGTNGMLRFIGCTFSNTIDMAFSPVQIRAIRIGGGAGGFNALVQNCVFNGTNSGGAAYMIAVDVNAAGAVATVAGNSYNLTNNASAANLLAVDVEAGTANIVGAINPSMVSVAVGAIANYDTAQFSGLGATPLNASELTSGTLPFAAVSGVSGSSSPGYVLSTTGSALQFVAQTGGPGGGGGSLVVVQTNWLLNTYYTNTNTCPIIVNGTVTNIRAAVTGYAAMELCVSNVGDAAWSVLSKVGMPSTASTPAEVYTNVIVGVISNNASFAWSNIVSGAGDASGFVAGTGQSTIMGSPLPSYALTNGNVGAVTLNNTLQAGATTLTNIGGGTAILHLFSGPSSSSYIDSEEGGVPNWQVYMFNPSYQIYDTTTHVNAMQITIGTDATAFSGSLAINGNPVTTNSTGIYFSYGPGSNLLMNLAPYSASANLVVNVICTNNLQVTITNPPAFPFMVRAWNGPTLTNGIWFNYASASTNAYPAETNNLTAPIMVIPTVSTNSTIDTVLSLKNTNLVIEAQAPSN